MKLIIGSHFEIAWKESPILVARFARISFKVSGFKNFSKFPINRFKITINRLIENWQKQAITRLIDNYQIGFPSNLLLSSERFQRIIHRFFKFYELLKYFKQFYF